MNTSDVLLLIISLHMNIPRPFAKPNVKCRISVGLVRGEIDFNIHSFVRGTSFADKQ